MLSILNQKRLLCLLGLSLLITGNLSAADFQVKQFDSRSLESIENNYTGLVFVVLVWSIDCLPCRKEFEMIQEVKKLHSKLNIVTIATESLKESPQIKDILSEHNLQKVDNWAFAKSHSSKLRYALDPSWYGELPRAYLYDSQGERLSVSGTITKGQLLVWLSKFKIFKIS